mgnify:FL=1
MINVRSLANMATQNVNPNRMVTLEVNQGYAVNEYGEQVAAFLSEEVDIQSQSLSNSDKRLLDGINLQGEYITIYVYGAVDGIRRWIQKGSSRFIFPAYGESDPVVWNVEMVAESWPTWTRVIACRQS